MSKGTCGGNCLCGAVQYIVHKGVNDNLGAAHCHCTMCRQWTGGLSVTAICFPLSAVHFIVDDNEVDFHHPPPALKSYRSSPTYVRQFCGTCGSSLFFYSKENDRVDVCGGTLREVKELKITEQIWCENVIPGMEVGPTEGVKMFEKGS
ncbi:Mss4-like protein [Schizophyllum amplum]|uniref:Mss4-like protein n=1 Tax=Schizophyllum amplum TaxID=97359 RepID=A0A550C1J2_9AGAR|nr:Mss4-like protein [Auriculariopsis ampla]